MRRHVGSFSGDVHQPPEQADLLHGVALRDILASITAMPGMWIGRPLDSGRRPRPSRTSPFANGGEKIVVDVQGVGDLLTDPQLHTREGNSGPGDGGPRGFGLFFATHKCNRICRRMGLQNFRTNEESLVSGSDTELEDEREDELGYDDVLRRLARTLDDVEKMDVGLTAADDLGTVLPDVVVDALPLEPIQDAAADSAAVLLREPHRELGKMLLDDDDGLTGAARGRCTTARPPPWAATRRQVRGPCARRGTSGAGGARRSS